MSPYRVECLHLTHWGRVTHICVSKLTIIGSDNGLSPRRRQAMIWTNAGILLIGPLGTHFREILIEIYTFPFKKMHLKMSSAEWRPFCLGLNVLSNNCYATVRMLFIHSCNIYLLVKRLCIVPLMKNTLPWIGPVFPLVSLISHKVARPI